MDLPGSLQLKILRHLWAGGPQTVRQVHAAVLATDQRQIAYTTVLTVMRTLAKRGLVDQARVTTNRGHSFSAKVDEQTYLATLAHDLVGTFYDGELDQFLACYDRQR